MAIKRVLWPTDFSPSSIAAASRVREFCYAFDARLFVVHVCPSPMAPIIGAVPPPSVQLLMRPHEFLKPADAQLKKLVEEQFEPLESLRHRVRHEALIGTAWLEVCNYARDNQIDLIILATHGHTGLRHVMLGSVAERIVQHAKCAVLVVKSPAKIKAIRPRKHGKTQGHGIAKKRWPKK